jgi:hypothetical protein
MLLHSVVAIINEELHALCDTLRKHPALVIRLHEFERSDAEVTVANALKKTTHANSLRQTLPAINIS